MKPVTVDPFVAAHAAIGTVVGGTANAGDEAAKSKTAPLRAANSPRMIVVPQAPSRPAKVLDPAHNRDNWVITLRELSVLTR